MRFVVILVSTFFLSMPSLEAIRFLEEKTSAADSPNDKKQLRPLSIYFFELSPTPTGPTLAGPPLRGCGLVTVQPGFPVKRPSEWKEPVADKSGHGPAENF